jgi:outer membrane immunogenic protein
MDDLPKTSPQRQRQTARYSQEKGDGVVRKRNLGLLAFAAMYMLPALGSKAGAADMAVKAPPAPPAMTSGWSGFYVGGEGGFLLNREIASTLFSTVLSTAGSRTSGNIDGGLGGFDVGYNYQVAPAWLVGAQIDGLWTGAKGSGTRPSNVQGVLLGGGTNDRWIVDLVGRLGYETGDWLIYGRGGLAWLKSDYTANATAGSVVLENGATSIVKTGFDVGVGVERKLVGNISGKIEYNYVDFGSKQIIFTFPGIGSNGANVRSYAHEFLAGVNFLFHP